MTRLLNYFFRGLIILAPAVITIYVFWLIFSTVDQWMGFRIPGLGIVVTIVLVTLFGFLATTVLARWLLSLVDTLFKRTPLVRLVYTSTRDLLDAFVGEKRRFDRPVVVTTSADGIEKAFGFVTSEAMARFGLDGHVTVYLPFSYTFTGVIRMYPVSQVRPLTADSAEVMAFVVSGGVTGE
ncbi:MAG TPA: DUF502 domain-containing protein [Gemmatimonadaceae bacterium]|nr:DUF502 domain-containing protein [Gemmatimonadaceae bacterium]